MASVILWPDLERLAERARRRFGLRPCLIRPITNPRDQRHGYCDLNSDPPVLWIRVHQLGKPHRPLARRTILDTLAHELAHLEVPDHDDVFRSWRRELKAFFKEEIL